MALQTHLSLYLYISPHLHLPKQTLSISSSRPLSLSLSRTLSLLLAHPLAQSLTLPLSLAHTHTHVHTQVPLFCENGEEIKLNVVFEIWTGLKLDVLYGFVMRRMPSPIHWFMWQVCDCR